MPPKLQAIPTQFKQTVQAKQAQGQDAARRRIAGMALERGEVKPAGAMTVTLACPPGVNNLYLTIQSKRGGTRRVLTKRGRDYKEQSAQKARDAGMIPVDGPVALYVDIYRPRRVGDLDGFLKAAIDSLIGVAFHDDKQVVRIVARRFDSKENPRAEVTVAMEGRT